MGYYKLLRLFNLRKSIDVDIGIYKKLSCLLENITSSEGFVDVRATFCY